MKDNDFLKILELLNEEHKAQAIDIILKKVKEANALDSKFYANKEKTKKLLDHLFDIIKTSDGAIETLIRIESGSPYSLFSYVLNENYSDFMFYYNGYSCSDGKEDLKIKLPKHLLSIYTKFLNHFVENVMFLSNQKFDTAHSVLDAEVGNMRFNLIHKTLVNNKKESIVVIRKQIVKKITDFGEEYIKTAASPKQIEHIKKYSEKGNFIIFGEVGSGKTTLLNYMANYKLENKRNLCIIEDTNELSVNVPISLLTNHHKKIKDLFIAALRQNPSSIIIGETRTDEIVDILESALTISVGTTIHANSFLRALQRIVFMSIKRNISSQEILDLTNAAIDCFIFMENRKVKELWVKKEEFNPNIYEAYEKI